MSVCLSALHFRNVIRDGIKTGITNLKYFYCLVRALLPPLTILPQHLAFWSWFLFENSASFEFCSAELDWTGAVTSQYEMQEMELFSFRKSQFWSIFHTKYLNISCTRDDCWLAQWKIVTCSSPDHPLI